jgi:hypothetical protein
LAVGSYRSLTAPEGGWVFARGHHTVVVLNMSDGPLDFNIKSGLITVATDRSTEGTSSGDTMSLSPWSGAVIES